MSAADAPLAPFTGFPKQGVAFFRALALAQSRDWFHAHKEDYAKLWRDPMASLLEELRAPMAKIYARKMAAPKIFRLNRDVRFANDKSPYKTHCSGLISFDGVGGPLGTIGIYLQLGLEEEAACGNWELDPDRLAKFRKLVLAEKSGGRLASAVAAAAKHGHSLTSMAALKRAPSGISMDHPRIELLRQKGLAISFGPIPSAARHSAELKDWLLAQAKIAAPVVQWAFEHKIAITSSSAPLPARQSRLRAP